MQSYAIFLDLFWISSVLLIVASIYVIYLVRKKYNLEKRLQEWQDAIGCEYEKENKQIAHDMMWAIAKFCVSKLKNGSYSVLYEKSLEQILTYKNGTLLYNGQELNFKYLTIVNDFNKSFNQDEEFVDIIREIDDTNRLIRNTLADSTLRHQLTTANPKIWLTDAENKRNGLKERKIFMYKKLSIFD